MNSIETLGRMRSGINSYTDAGDARKTKMHTSGRAFLRRLAADLGLEKGSYDIRSNRGGIAVSGEVTLHGESIYVQISESCIGRGGLTVMYRKCNGRKDYCGQQNNFASMSDVAKQYPQFVARVRAVMQG